LLNEPLTGVNLKSGFVRLLIAMDSVTTSCCQALPEAGILRVAPDAQPSLNQLARRPNPIPRWPIIPTF